MSSDALVSLQTEIQLAREALAPQLEGFHDLASVDLQAESMKQVHMDIDDATRRDELMGAVLEALKMLTLDGYPNVPIIKVKGDVYEDLAEQKRTIDAALSRYAPLPPEAVSGRVTIEEGA